MKTTKLAEHLPPQLQRTLDIVARYHGTLGRGPSIAEVAKELGLGKSGGAVHLHELRRRGLPSGPKIVNSGDWRPTALGKKHQSA
jgi:hypothetical protein